MTWTVYLLLHYKPSNSVLIYPTVNYFIIKGNVLYDATFLGIRPYAYLLRASPTVTQTKALLRNCK